MKLHLLAVFSLAFIINPSRGYGASEEKFRPKPVFVENKTPKQIMDSIMEAMVGLIPNSLDLAKFSSVDNREENLQRLKVLDANVGLLIQHGSKRDKSFAFLSESLGRDVRELNRRYEKRQYQETQFLLYHVVENCVGCHTKLPEGAPAPNLNSFFKNVQLDNLSFAEKAILQTALRQFDDAMKTYEAYFANTKKTSDLLRADSIVEYLKLAIRVKNEPRRALAALNGIAKRNDLPKFLAAELAAWINALERVSKLGEIKTNQLATAVKIIQEAQKKMEYAVDRAGVVDYIFASGLLNRFVNQPLRPKDQEAEAYYWLGITESLIGRTYWVSQTENYLEACIRVAPKGKYAPKAFRMLEQYVIFQYTGSMGTDIPEDVTKKLSTLQHLIYE